MTHTRFGDQECRKVQITLDSHIDGLTGDNDPGVTAHLQGCAACTLEAETRRNVRKRLKAAVREVAVPIGLEARIRGRLRQSKAQPRKLHLMAIAATFAVGFGYWMAYRFGNSPPGREHVFAALDRVAGIMRVGVGDHLHCAVILRGGNRRGPENRLPREFQGLMPVVSKSVPMGLPLTVAHECHHRGRRFVHLTFQNERSVASLVIARKEDGESLRDTQLPSRISAGGVPLYTAGMQTYQVAALENERYLIYVVSEMPAKNNVDLLAAMAPGIDAFFNRTAM